MTKSIIIASLLIILSACSTTKDGKSTNQNTILPEISTPMPAHPKNVILMIGDGMGLTQITAGMISNGYHLNLEKIKTIGLHKSYSFNDLITDSAAGATAFSIGRKSFNGAIGVGPDTLAYITILEEAEEKGMATGLIATSTIVHATPAAFIAHNWSRNDYEGIALDFLQTDIDCFIGGGKKYFNRRKDEKDLIEGLKKKGYQVSDFIDGDIQSLKIDKDRLAYFTSDGDPLPAAQGRDYLDPASKKAIDFLSQKNKGFFMMIEGSQIDWGGHSNMQDYIISEMLDFDKTVGNVLDWAKKDGNTLVVITADHETGGFAINPGSTRDSIVGKFTTDKHTGTLIPVFAFGPGEEMFNGFFENTAIYAKMRAALGWPAQESARKK